MIETPPYRKRAKVFHTRCCQDKQVDQTWGWSDQRILAAIDAALETAGKICDEDRQAVVFWIEWATMEPHVPISRRKSIICFLDRRLSAKGLPTLRQLVGMTPVPRRAAEVG